MQRFSIMLLAVATMSAPSVTLVAQNAYIFSAGESGGTQSIAAPIERQTAANGSQNGALPQQSGPQITTSQPAHGVTVRTDLPAALHTVSSDAHRTELKLDHGRANVIVRGPAPDMLLLVDLPGGQAQLLKDGFYTFNADTNTVRVLTGEADAFAATSEKPVKVKSDDSLVFVGAQAKLSYSNPSEARHDILQGGVYPQGGVYAGSRDPRFAATPPYGYAPYGYAAYGPYAYGAWDGYYGYPYGYYPYYGFGGPYWGGIGFGIGFGGYYGGGYGYRGFGGFGGFRGGRR